MSKDVFSNSNIRIKDTGEKVPKPRSIPARVKRTGPKPLSEEDLRELEAEIDAGKLDTVYVEIVVDLVVEIRRLQAVVDEAGIITGEDAVRMAEDLRNPKSLSDEVRKRLQLDDREHWKQIGALLPGPRKEIERLKRALRNIHRPWDPKGKEKLTEDSDYKMGFNEGAVEKELHVKWTAEKILKGEELPEDWE